MSKVKDYDIYMAEIFNDLDDAQEAKDRLLKEMIEENQVLWRVIDSIQKNHEERNRRFNIMATNKERQIERDKINEENNELLKEILSILKELKNAGQKSKKN